MSRIINRSTTKGNIIVRIVASLDMQAGIIFGIGLHARQKLGIMQRIGIAQNMRHFIHERHADNASPLYLSQLRAKALTPNLNCLKSIMIERVGQFSRHALEYAEYYINKYAENYFHYLIFPLIILLYCVDLYQSNILMKSSTMLCTLSTTVLNDFSLK